MKFSKPKSFAGSFKIKEQLSVCIEKNFKSKHIVKICTLSNMSCMYKWRGFYRLFFLFYKKNIFIHNILS